MSLLSFFKRDYYPLNTIEISETALLANYRYLSNLDSTIKIAPVLKSNAYGHGLSFVAKILDNAGAPFLCVDSLYEAYDLLKNNIKTPILIMGYVNPDNLRVKKLPFSYAVYDKKLVEGISKYQRYAGIHIFVDTGMNREGVHLSDLPEFVAYIKSFGNLRIEGLMSHLGAAHIAEATKKQLDRFEKAKKIIDDAGFQPKWFHMSPSTGLLHKAEYKGRLGNLSRCGISLYGIDPEEKDKKLQPVLQLTTTLNQIKFLPKGESVGYDFTFTAKKDMTIGILPIGYFDGVDRRLSNKGFVLMKNSLCPIIGRVSMNLTTVDISNVENPKVGDTVIVFSNNSQDKNSIYNSALLAQTIPYDLLIHLAASTRRIVVA
jgi:alanine racemase